MLGSVFNRHQASTSSEPSKAKFKAKLRTFKVGKDACPFSEFKGLGSPSLDIGLPGDIYIDITPGLHALYARYPESWLLWPGSRDASVRTLLLHPRHSDRCLWCHDSIGWFHPKHIRVNPLNASELLSNTLEFQAKVLEESKKRKRDALHQPARPKPSSFSSNSPSQDRNSLENQNPPDILSVSPSRTPYSQPAPEIIPTDVPTTQSSEYRTSSPTTDSRQASAPTMTDHTFTPNQPSERNLQQHTSSGRIDLRKMRKITFGDAKPRPFARSQKRRTSSPTRSRSVSYPDSEEQSIPQHRSTIRDSGIFRNDEASLTQANSAAMLPSQPLVNDVDLQTLPSEPISSNLSDTTGGSCVSEPPHRSTPFAATHSGSLAEATKRKHINKEFLQNFVVQLRRVKDASDANIANLQAANDKIRRLEAENAELRAQLLNPCQSSLSFSDPSPMVEIPPNADSDALNDALDADERNSKRLPDAEGVNQSQRGSAGSREIVTNVPSTLRFCPRNSPCEVQLGSSSVINHSATPTTSLLLADTPMLTETTSPGESIPAAESATVESQNVDILKVEADSLSLDECNSMNMNISPLVKEEIIDIHLVHASSPPPPTSTTFPMREIHKSVLFAKAGTLLICRICLGTKLGGVETVDQVFQTSEELPEVMQEHCEKEHPDDCAALMNMRDEDLLDVVSMIRQYSD